MRNLFKEFPGADPAVLREIQQLTKLRDASFKRLQAMKEADDASPEECLAVHQTWTRLQRQVNQLMAQLQKRTTPPDGQSARIAGRSASRPSGSELR